MEAASFLSDITATWKSCVDVFNIVGQSKSYGPDQELWRAKLEVERVRLLAWGDAVGLTETKNEGRRRDTRLDEFQTKTNVLRVLGDINRIFSDVKALQDRYGLIPIPQQNNAAPVSGVKRLLRKVRKASVTLDHNTIWYVHDRMKVREMVREIRESNDSLCRLFADLRFANAVGREIEQRSEIRPLFLLSEACQVEYPEIFDVLSHRLGQLGVSKITTTHSTLRGVEERTMIPGSSSSPNNDLPATADREGGRIDKQLEAKQQTASATLHTASTAGITADVLEALEERFEKFEIEIGKGALDAYLIGPTASNAQSTAHVRWKGLDKQSDLPFGTQHRGFVKSQHAAFDAYHKKNFKKKLERGDYADNSEEDGVFFDPESHPKYENVNPGTLTLEGFALEIWEYEQLHGIDRKITIMVSTGMMEIPADRILRRLDELRTDPRRLDLNRQEDHLDLHEFLAGTTRWANPAHALEPANELSELYSSLNRDDIFVDFLHQAAIIVYCFDPVEVCNLLLQVILGTELARRMQQYPDGWVSGFTTQVLAKLIVSEQWIRNVRVEVEALPIPAAFKKIPSSAGEARKADELNEEGNVAANAGKAQEALDLYTKALEIGGRNAVYAINRSIVHHSISKTAEALLDALVAIDLDPKSAQAWGCLGAAQLQFDNLDAALEAYEKAIQLAGKGKDPALEAGLKTVEMKIRQWNSDFESAKDPKQKHEMGAKMRDRKWGLLGKTIQLYSNVHESQVDGLLVFAERMRWPYMNEARTSAEEAYITIRNGGKSNPLVVDWLFGLTLPGKHFAFKIMATLIQCSPSVSENLGQAKYLDSNLVLEKQSYWGTRSVLGRVLGAMPGVKSLGGWIGPLPAVQISPPATGTFKPLLVRLKARQVPPQRPVEANDNTIYIGGRHDRYKYTKAAADEDIHAYIADMTSHEAYTAPTPPAQSQSNVSVSSIGLKRLAPESGDTGKMGEGEAADEAEYRASVTFSLGPRQSLVTYTLYTNPIFVTLPPCYNGPHKVHRRELQHFQLVPWEVEKLKDHVSDEIAVNGEDADYMMINGTGNGAEVLARAWCSERGKHAVVVRESGPCQVCAIRNAQMLEIKVIIWVR